MARIIKISAKGTRWEEMYEAQSDSRPGDAYIVAKGKDGSWACSCPAWIYHTPRKPCKHILRVQFFVKQGAPQAAEAKPILNPEKIQRQLSRFALLEE